MNRCCEKAVGVRYKVSGLFPPKRTLTAITPATVLSYQHRNFKDNQQKKSIEFYKQIFPTSYYFDEEKASRDQQMRSLDCVMDNTLVVPRFVSWAAIKKRISMYMRRKRLKDRRPDLTKEVICQRYLEYKALTNSVNELHLSKLGEYTTEAEAKRICEMQRAKKYAEQRQMSWKDLSMQMTDHSKSSSGGDPSNNTKSEKPLSIDKPHYSLHLESFEIVGGFYGSINQDDWLQLNYKAVGKEVIRKSGPGGASVPIENELLEYPVIEVHLTDGIRKRNMYMPIVVALMDRTGCRYGRDGVDAAQMRRQIAAGTSWLS